MGIGKHWLKYLVFWGFCLAILTGCRTDGPPRWHWARAEAGLPRHFIATALAVDPLDSDRLWVGSYAPGGLAMSQNGGQSWTMLGPDRPGLADNPVFDLLALPPGDLWAATRDGLLLTTDAGLTWQRVGAGLPPATVFALAADGAGRVYAGLNSAGIYRQAASGQAWQPLFPRTEEKQQGTGPLAATAVLSLAVSEDGRQLYAGTAGSGLLASRNGGRTWTRNYPDRYVPNVALNPLDPKMAIASLRQQLVRTTDGGRSWHTLPVAWAEDELVSLLWTADGLLGAGTGQGQLYRSPDSGDSWEASGIGLPPGASVLALAVVDAGPGIGPRRFLAGTWNGLYSREEGDQPWTELAPSLGVPHAQALLNTGRELWLGTRAGLFLWQPAGRRWLAAPDGFPAKSVTSLAVAPSTTATLYAGTNRGLHRNAQDGQGWEQISSLQVGIPALAVDPAQADHLYMLAAWERVYESWDGGQTWQARWDGLGTELEAVSLAVDPVAPVVYVGTETGLFRSQNGAAWQPGAPAVADQSILTLLAQPLPARAGGGSVLYLGTTRGAYRSLDQGRTVQAGEATRRWGRSLAGISVTAFLVDPVDPRRLLAGTAYAGLYQSPDWGFSWFPMGPAGLKDEVVEALAWGPDGALFVAAEKGLWRGMIAPEKRAAE